MGCGDGPNIHSQCNDLKQYYKKVHKSRCQYHTRLHCPKGQYRYHKTQGSCADGWDHSCCAPVNPPPNAISSFQCCTGIVSGDKAKGYCNAKSCPYSNQCNQYMESTCPSTGNIGAWFSQGGNCSDYVSNSLKSTMPGARNSAATLVGKTVQNYFPDTYKPNDLKDTAFPKKTKIAKTGCGIYPGPCKAPLTDWCKTVTRKDVIKNPDLLTLCGCFMPDKEYPYSGFVSRACETTCNNGTAILRVGETCDQTVCIIDNVDVNMVNSEGNVNLNQICGKDGNSVCLLKDIDVNAINSKVGGGVTVDQQCTRCYKWQGDTTGQISDEELLKQPGYEDKDGWHPPPGWVPTSCQGEGSSGQERKWIVIGVIVAFLVGLALLALLLLVA